MTAVDALTMLDVAGRPPRARARSISGAVVFSGAIHAGLIIGALLLLRNVESLEPGGIDAISVELVSMPGIEVMEAAEVESEMAVNLTAAGALAEEAVEVTAALEVPLAEAMPVETDRPSTVPETATESVDAIDTAEPIVPESVVEPKPEAVVEAADPARVEPTEVEPVRAEETQQAQAKPVQVDVAAEVQRSAEAVEAITAAANVEPVAPSAQVLAVMPTEALVAADPAPLETEASASVVQPDRVEMTVAEEMPATAAEAVAEAVPQVAAATALEPEPAASTALPATTEVIEPTLDEELPVIPVPATRRVAQTAEPTYPEPVKEPPPKKKPAETPAPPAPSQQASAAGGGGADETDSAASKDAGAQGQEASVQTAAVNKYPGQIQARLRRALRFPKNARGAQGEVHVRFVVSRSGDASQIRVVKSSGSEILDAAAVATVERAAPFPPIPDGYGKANWTFTLPLLFRQ